MMSVTDTSNTPPPGHHPSSGRLLESQHSVHFHAEQNSGHGHTACVSVKCYFEKIQLQQCSANSLEAKWLTEV